MNYITLTLIFFTIFASKIVGQEGTITTIQELPGLDNQTFMEWQQIINDAALYDGDSGKNEAISYYQSLSLDELSQVVSFYSNPLFQPYQKGIQRLNQIIYRINTHSYPAN